MKLLELNAIETGYGKLSILRGISLGVAQGEIYSIVGSNGAGKTTLLKTISGLLKTRKGTILLAGDPIGNLPPHRIVEKGLIQVPEARRLFPYLSVLTNLEIGSYNRSARPDRSQTLEKVFNLFPVLRERKDLPAKSLSGGEQQMLAIGRGLMAKPSILMLDEPSLGLSPIIVDRIFEIIRKINEDGVTIVLVEQRVDMSLQIAHSASVLENGAITLFGPGKALLENDHLRKAYLGL